MQQHGHAPPKVKSKCKMATVLRRKETKLTGFSFKCHYLNQFYICLTKRCPHSSRKVLKNMLTSHKPLLTRKWARKKAM